LQFIEKDYKVGKFRMASWRGRKPQDPRKVFKGILYMLRTGCQWKAPPKSDFGSASAVHKYLLEWHAAGLFEQLWHVGLLEYNVLEVIAWEWQSLDGAIVKAAMALESGRQESHRQGGEGSTRSLLVDESGVPLSIQTAYVFGAVCPAEGTSLPRINPDLAMNSPHPIQLDGLRGPLI
jgi:transposase